MTAQLRDDRAWLWVKVTLTFDMNLILCTDYCLYLDDRVMFVEGASYGCQRRVPTKGANEGCQRRVPTKGALDACTSSCFRLRIVVGSTGSISQLGPLSGHTGE